MAELFGREGELAEIRAFLDGAEGVRALLVAGGPGIGKTALWSEGLEQARRRGLRTTATRPSQAEAALPFAALIDLLSELADEALPALSTPQARALESVLLRAEPDRSPAMHLLVSVAVLRALEEIVRRAPVILGIDDLQWLDEPSARALGYALRRLGGSPVWLVATRRHEGGTAPGRLEDALGPELVHRIELGPVGPGALGMMLRERLGLVLPQARLRAVLERSGGNPLHALELGRMVLAGASLAPGETARVPETLGGLVAERVRVLDGRTRRALLEVAALSRPSMELLDATGDELETAVAAGLLERSGDAVRFSHPLYASAIYTAATVGERRAVHRDLAGRITEPAERALHLALAAEGPDDRLAAHLEEVAREVSERGAADTAAELARQALRLTSHDDGAAAARRGLAAAEYLFAAGDGPAAQATLEELIAALPAGPLRAEALWRRADAPGAGDFGTRLRVLEAARAEAGEEPELCGRIELARAILSQCAGDGDRYLHHTEAAVACARAAPGGELLADALSELGLARFVQGHGVEEELMRRALAVAPTRLSYLVETPRTRLGMMLTWAGRLDEARPLLEADLGLASARGDVAAEALMIYHLTELECWARNLPRADELGQRCLELARQLPPSNAEQHLRYGAALVDAYRGRVEAAREGARLGGAAARAMGDGLGEMRNELVLGFLALSLGDPGRACEHLSPLVEWLRSSSYVEPGAVPALPLAAEAMVGVGDLDRATALADELAELGGRLDRPWARVTAARCHALAAAAAGDIAGALGRIASADPDDRRLGDPFERARTRLVQGTLLRRLKKRGAARRAIEDAMAAFTAIGTPLWAERAREELERLGLRPSAGQLTESESRIAALAASGATNREIASQLFVSVKTVEANLSRTYRKLGVRSRVELARRLSAEGYPSRSAPPG
jgi:DNA-binding CsgD family transcriptional regulator/tetratricopeptide (TPR) repeat protein